MMTVSEYEIKQWLKSIPGGVKISIALPNGKEFTVDKQPTTKQEIIEQQYGDLVGVPITLSEAARKYGVPRGTIRSWLDKGYLQIITKGYAITVDEADVAYCADIYRQKKETGIGFRGPLLDKDGLPYQLKHPSLSIYRKRKKKTA